MSLLLRRVEVDEKLADVRIDGGLVQDVGRPGLAVMPAEEEIDGHGGALLPGLHDHHLHVLALAAARSSVDCGRGLTQLRTAPGGGWIRGINYHEQTDGDVDRHLLDQIVADRPVRVQHSSGALWMLNSEALLRVRDALDGSADVERDENGEPTGRLWRYDARLRPALPETDVDLDALSRELSAFGITGVTDATPDLDDDAIALLATLRQHVVVLGADSSARLPHDVVRGPRKLLLRDHDLPSFDALSEVIRVSHADGRPVAVHCVTRESLVLTLAALEEVGALLGDRIEHAAVTPPELVNWLHRLGVAVVTQPDFLRTRGSAYQREVAPEDLPHLYSHARLLAAGVPTTASSDAPYGGIDPWRVVATACNRPLGSGENVTARQALDGYLSDPLRPGGPPRRIRPGVGADVVLLHAPLHEVLRHPNADAVRATWIAGDRQA